MWSSNRMKTMKWRKSHCLNVLTDKVVDFWGLKKEDFNDSYRLECELTNCFAEVEVFPQSYLIKVINDNYRIVYRKESASLKEALELGTTALYAHLEEEEKMYKKDKERVSPGEFENLTKDVLE